MPKFAGKLIYSLVRDNLGLGFRRNSGDLPILLCFLRWFMNPWCALISLIKFPGLSGRIGWSQRTLFSQHNRVFGLIRSIGNVALPIMVSLSNRVMRNEGKVFRNYSKDSRYVYIYVYIYVSIDDVVDYRVYRYRCMHMCTCVSMERAR